MFFAHKKSESRSLADCITNKDKRSASFTWETEHIKMGNETDCDIIFQLKKF